MAGVGFPGDHIRVALFKSLRSVPDPNSAHNWARSYHNVVSKTVSDYAGRSHHIDPTWVNVLRTVIGQLPADQKQGDPRNGATDPAGKAPMPILEAGPASGSDVAAVGEGEDAPAGFPPSAEGVPPWLLFGLRVVLAVLDTTRRTKVLTTVFWYTPEGMARVDMNGASAWIPLHQLYASSGRRSAHGIWNADGPMPNESPSIWSGSSPKWRGLGVEDMPHEPWQWCQAFYPTVDCGGPAITGEQTNVGQADSLSSYPTSEDT
jgi:hypothetical protein